MLFYRLIGHGLANEVQTITQVYYPNEHYYQTEEVQKEGMTVESRLTDTGAEGRLFLDGVLLQEGACAFLETPPSLREQKRAVKAALSCCFQAQSGYHPLWGIITGIRPTKMVNEWLDEGKTEQEISAFLQQAYGVSPAKTALTMEVARAERAILAKSRPEDYSLYIGIPFCPTRCLYCSFTSYPLNRYAKWVDGYLDHLEEELAFLSARLVHQKPMTVYVGGGTPTSLNERQLERLLQAVHRYFDLQEALEFTVEAGRPDTITKEKLQVMKENGVDRISINPQTMNEKTLALIGRSHHVLQVKEVFALAREVGFTNINMDLILGLPEETVEDVRHTLREVEALSPDSLTVHTLAVKRASRLKEQFDQYDLTSAAVMEEMLEESSQTARRMGMAPYYMYRQKNMVGNFENVGYCRPGKESVYNVEIMEERQTIFAVGAGSTTKLYEADKNRVSRVFNVKGVEEYDSRFAEMLCRKEAGWKGLSLPMIGHKWR